MPPGSGRKMADLSGKKKGFGADRVKKHVEAWLTPLYEEESQTKNASFRGSEKGWSAPAAANFFDLEKTQKNFTNSAEKASNHATQKEELLSGREGAGAGGKTLGLKARCSMYFSGLKGHRARRKKKSPRLPAVGTS